MVIHCFHFIDLELLFVWYRNRLLQAKSIERIYAGILDIEYADQRLEKMRNTVSEIDCISHAVNLICVDFRKEWDNALRLWSAFRKLTDGMC